MNKDKAKVYEIDRNGKYIIQLPDGISMQDGKILKKEIDEWLAGDDPFIYLFGDDVKLVKVA